MPPIILDPSDSEEALVNAIVDATQRNEPLLLKPGTHFTKRGRNRPIAVGVNGLSLRPWPDSRSPNAAVVIKRPDHSIICAKPDYNHGLSFIPAAPTHDEMEGIVWKSHVDAEGKRFEYGVIVRGNIEIADISIDCNMRQQEIETLDKDAAEHSAMLVFAGQKYQKYSIQVDGVERKRPIPKGPGGVTRYVYVGFESVSLNNVTTLNGDYADDVWFSRGYFNPNIRRVVIAQCRSGPRLKSRRATISFSGLCQDIQIRDVDFDRLEMEDTMRQHYDELPRQASVFTPAQWTLSNVKAKHIDLAAKGKVYQLDAETLTATESFYVYQAGGVIRNSTLQVGKERRLIRLDDLVFDQVTWQLAPNADGVVRGLKPTSQHADPCSVTFRRNNFTVTGPSVGGEIISSSYSGCTQGNCVTASFLGCTYPQDFGRSVEKPIARVNEPGVWTFDAQDLGDRECDVAIVKGRKPGIEIKCE